MNKDNIPQGDAWWNSPIYACGQPAPLNSIFNFWAIIGYGYLNSDGSVALGMLSMFDQCSADIFPKLVSSGL